VLSAHGIVCGAAVLMVQTSLYLFSNIRIYLFTVSPVLFHLDLAPFLGAFTKLRKATISLVMSVRPSAENNLATTGRIFMKFDM